MRRQFRQASTQVSPAPGRVRQLPPRIIAFTLALCDTCLWADTVVSRCRALPHWFLDKNGL